LQEAMQLQFNNLMLSRVHKTSATFIKHNKMKGLVPFTFIL